MRIRLLSLLFGGLLLASPVFSQTLPGGGGGAVQSVSGQSGILVSPTTGNPVASLTSTLGNSGANITASTYTVNLTAPGDLGSVLNFTGTGASAWTLGTAAYGDGFGVKNSGTANITITATGNINGASTLVLTPGQSASIYADPASTTWWAAVANPSAGLSVAGSSGDLQMNSGSSTLAASHVNDNGTIVSVTENANTHQNYISTEIPNASGGTTNQKLATINTSGQAVLATTSNTTGIIGIVASGGGTTGNAAVAVAGIASCIFDGATTAGDFVIASTTSGGECHDGTSTDPTGVAVIGNVLSTNGGAGTYAILLYPPDITSAGTTGNPGGGNGGVKIGTLTSPDVTCASGSKTITNCSDQNFVWTDKNQVFTASQASTPVTVSISTTTYTPNFNTGQNFTITFTTACNSSACTLANPSTTLVPGQTGVIEFIQPSSGGSTTGIGTWGSEYYYPGGTSTITFSTGASDPDYFSYYVDANSHIVLTTAALNATH